MSEDLSRALELARSLVPLSPDDALSAREAALAALPRIGTEPVRSRQELVTRVEQIALWVGEHEAEQRAAEKPDAWRMLDLLDEVLDVLDAVKGTPTTAAVVSDFGPEVLAADIPRE